MKIRRQILLQAAVWISIWSIFVFAGGTADKSPNFYFMWVVRVAGDAIFFNVVYYLILPFYFSGRKKVFYWLSPLVFVVYLSLKIVIDFNLDERYRNQQQEADQTEQPARKEIPWLFIILPRAFMGLVLFGTAASFRGFSAFEKKKEAEEEANRRRLEAEIKLLKSQINPHFLLNTLNNLYAIALTEPEKTPDGLLKLSEMMNYILYECAKPEVPLVLDIEFIENYIALQRLRLPPNSTLHVELPKTLPKDLYIEPMILIPFIENAFKHGLTTKQACDIYIAIKINNNQLTLCVKNPVLPPKQAQTGNPSGVGLANTQQRLKHSYPENHRLEIKNDGQEHQVKLELNLE